MFINFYMNPLNNELGVQHTISLAICALLKKFKISTNITVTSARLENFKNEFTVD